MNVHSLIFQPVPVYRYLNEINTCIRYVRYQQTTEAQFMYAVLGTPTPVALVQRVSLVTHWALLY